MPRGWIYKQHRCDWTGCMKMATVGNYCVEHRFQIEQELKEIMSVKPVHPCTCTKPRQTCSTCEADMSLRNRGFMPDPDIVARYGAPSWD